MQVLLYMIVIPDLFFTIVIQLFCNGYHTFVDIAWISHGYDSDIGGVVTPYYGVVSKLIQHI